MQILPLQIPTGPTVSFLPPPCLAAQVPAGPCLHTAIETGLCRGEMLAAQMPAGPCLHTGDLQSVSSEAMLPVPEMGGFLSALTANFAPPPAQTQLGACRQDAGARAGLNQLLGLLQWLLALLPVGMQPFVAQGGSATPPAAAALPLPTPPAAASGGQAPVLPYDGRPSGGGLDPERIHMTQVYDRKYNRQGAPRSADCGPTSLAMGLEALGLSPGGSVQDKVDAARLAMFRGGDASKDGYANGRRSQAEHGTSTNISDWRRGAQAAGARTRDVRSAEDVAREVSQGHPVMLAGRNAGNIYGRGHGISFNGGHAILVSGYDRGSDTFILNDPLSHGGPIRVSRAQLAAFLWDGDGGGVDGIALMR